MVVSAAVSEKGSAEEHGKVRRRVCSVGVSESAAKRAV